MSRHHRASDRERTLPFGIAADWTPEQAFAVAEMLDELRELIYARYLPQIQDQMRADRQSVTRVPCNDDPPFCPPERRIKTQGAWRPLRRFYARAIKTPPSEGGFTPALTNRLICSP
jgi:hypothetical protein